LKFCQKALGISFAMSAPRHSKLMTLKIGFHTLVGMFTEAQNQYLNDVLGVAPSHFVATGISVKPRLPFVVLTPQLSAAEMDLFAKILASVQLEHVFHVQDLAWNEQPAHHVLVFGSELAHGRQQKEDTVWWSVPALSEMMGTDATVTMHKKFTWNLLQALRKEQP